MPPVNLDEIKSTFFVFGYLSGQASPELERIINNYGSDLQVHNIPDHGSYYFTSPFYADVAEDDHMLWIKFGLAHDNQQRTTTQDLLQRGWLNREGALVDKIRGSYSLVGLMKHEMRAYVFRNLVSPAGLVYQFGEGNLLVADNLRLLTHFLPNAEPDQDLLVAHHIYRQLFGASTYIKGVKNMLGGEMIVCNQGEIHLEARQDFRRMENQENQKQVNSETVAWFFEQLSKDVGYRLDGFEDQSVTMLSGGVDSSTMQAAINTCPGIDFPFPSYSFVVDSPGFQFEVDYANEAAQLLGTQHQFLPVEPEKFPDWLMSSISILGMPVHFDAPPSYYALAKHIQETDPGFIYMFNGANADVLTGSRRALALVQGDKYKTWPIWALKTMAALLKPVSPSKSFGARTAAETLKSMQDPMSIENPFNRSSTCDWDLVLKYFPRQSVDTVFNARWEILAKYTSSQFLCERRQIMSLIMDGMTTPVLERQLGLFCGRVMWFPFSDDALIEAVYSFEPLDRFSHDYRVKPLMRMALESQVPASVTRKPKGNSSAFEQAMIPWMKDGSLRPLVQEIERPGYISQAEFQKALDDPSWFTWNMLTLDLFNKHGIK